MPVARQPPPGVLSSHVIIHFKQDDYTAKIPLSQISVKVKQEIQSGNVAERSFRSVQPAWEKLLWGGLSVPNDEDRLGRAFRRTGLDSSSSRITEGSCP